MSIELAPGSFVNLDRLTAVGFGQEGGGELTAARPAGLSCSLRR
jgi:hypothetical protein